jgi:hypothetical protein
MEPKPLTAPHRSEKRACARQSRLPNREATGRCLPWWRLGSPARRGPSAAWGAQSSCHDMASIWTAGVRALPCPGTGVSPASRPFIEPKLNSVASLQVWHVAATPSSACNADPRASTGPKRGSLRRGSRFAGLNARGHADRRCNGPRLCSGDATMQRPPMGRSAPPLARFTSAGSRRAAVLSPSTRLPVLVRTGSRAGVAA